MKFCPYCGANLIEENVLFSSNCGKKLPPHEAGITEPLTEEMRPEPEKTPKVEPSTKKKGRKKKASNKKATRVVDEPPVDDGYDGYYDDVQPPDLDRVKEGLDKELIKKIVALSVGVVFIIALCVVMMYVL